MNDTVKFKLNIPTTQGVVAHEIESGTITFLLGPNGSGKSTLMQKFNSDNANKCRRITAHRQVWFNSDGLELTPASRKQVEQNINSTDRHEQSRYKDDYAAQRAQAVFFDLIDSENVEARKIAFMARSGNMSEVAQLAKEKSPIEKMNDILKVANLEIKISIDEGSRITAEKEGYQKYGIAELSDGERNALIIIANVLTAPSSTLILIDEPERHLHRSIVSPLLTTLLHYRDDCSIVVSTHDVYLPLDQHRYLAFLIREYKHKPKTWKYDSINSEINIDDSIARVILGSRRVILLVEGNATSLDLQLYQILLPGITILPMGSCWEVERNVSALRSISDQHWIKAFGIIDKDNRGEAECKKLIENGIFCLKSYSVESLYYNPVVIRCILERLSVINSINVDDVYNTVLDSALLCLGDQIERLSARMVERKIKDELNRLSPNWREVLKGNCSVSYSAGSCFDDERKLLQTAIKDKNLEGIICRYPVRETRMLDDIAKNVGFRSREKYEDAVRKACSDSLEFRMRVICIISPIDSLIKQ